MRSTSTCTPNNEPRLQFFSSKRWLVSFSEGKEVVQEIDWDDCLLKYEDLPKLLTASDSLISAELLASIAQACIKRLKSKTEGMTKTVQRLRDENGVKPSFRAEEGVKSAHRKNPSKRRVSGQLETKEGVVA